MSGDYRVPGGEDKASTAILSGGHMAKATTPVAPEPITK